MERNFVPVTGTLNLFSEFGSTCQGPMVIFKINPYLEQKHQYPAPLQAWISKLDIDLVHFQGFADLPVPHLKATPGYWI